MNVEAKTTPQTTLEAWQPLLQYALQVGVCRQSTLDYIFAVYSRLEDVDHIWDLLDDIRLSEPADATRPQQANALLTFWWAPPEERERRKCLKG